MLIPDRFQFCFQIRDNYWRMLPDVARKGCVLFEEDQDPDAGISCDLQNLLDQINILATASLALRQHDVSVPIAFRPHGH